MINTAKEVTMPGAGLDNLQEIAARLLELAYKHAIWLFEGEMGAGKTTLIKALCQQLAVTDNVTSPTFSLVNEYRAEAGPVYHFDFYRVNDLEEALQAGVEEYFYTGNFCFIEWPSVIMPVLPTTYVKIIIEPGRGEARNYKLVFYDNI